MKRKKWIVVNTFILGCLLKTVCGLVWAVYEVFF